MGGEIYAAGGNKVALTLTPGSGGTFLVTLNGKTVYDKKVTGKYPELPDAKEIKAKVLNLIG